MTDESLDVLLRARKELEAEISAAVDQLAAKRKALESLSTTIGYMRTWKPAEPTPEPAPFQYDEPKMISAMEDFFLQQTDPVHLQEVCTDLENLGLIPTYSSVAQNTALRLIKAMVDIKSTGFAERTRYYLAAR